MLLEEIKTLDCGSWFGNHWKNERVPSLREVLSILPDNRNIFIEVKTKKEIVPFLLSEMQEQGTDLNQVTVISFFPEVVKEIKRREEKLKCNLLISFDYKKIETNEIIDLANSVEADGVGAQNHKELNENLIQLLRDQGKSSHVWTVNTRSEAKMYMDMGIESITTNKPLFVRNYLEGL